MRGQCRHDYYFIGFRLSSTGLVLDYEACACCSQRRAVVRRSRRR